MDLELNSRVALVTGGASGIGAACAQALADEGMTVAILDRDAAHGSSLVAGMNDRGGKAIFVETDVTDETSVAAAVRAVVTACGGLDVLVTSAGVSGPVGKNVTQMTRAEWDQVLAVNVTGIFLVARHCLQYLEQSVVGTLVLIGSDASFAAFSGMAPYCTSKGAVLMLARSLSIDHPAVRVNCLCPSVVDTSMVRKDLGLDDNGIDNLPFPVMSADQLARHALFLASPISAPINGTSLIVDFGYSARTAFPTLAFSGLVIRASENTEIPYLKCRGKANVSLALPRLPRSSKAGEADETCFAPTNHKRNFGVSVNIRDIRGKVLLSFFNQ